MRQRYLLDNENLCFHKEEISNKQRAKIAVGYLGGGLALALIVWCLFFVGVISSPKKVVLNGENEILVDQLADANDQLDNLAYQLSQVQIRDDHFYRVISGIEPVPSTKRQAGFGGTDKYAHLKGFENSDLVIKSLKKSDILIKQLHIQSESYDTVIYLAQAKQDSLLAVPGIVPVAPGEFHRISDRFGKRVHPITGKVHTHTGLDFAAQIGKKIHTTGNGKVVSVRKLRRGYGNVVIIKHGFGFKTLYAHMNDIYVKVGEEVKRGQTIGTVGNTGTSTGPHLHYEVMYKNRKKDPDDYYIEDLTDLEFKEMIGLLTSKTKSF